MSTKKMLTGLTLLTILAIFAAQSYSQQGGGEGRGRRGEQQAGQAGGPAGQQMGQRDPEQMRQMMLERQIQRVKQALNPTDEQWAKIEPALKKVITLTQQTNRAAFPGQAFGRQQGQTEEANEEQTELAKAARELRTAVNSSNADAIKTKLEAFRRAREEALKQLTEAKKELKATLTGVQQEAELVLMGYLD
ncbi:MAG TPA: hypothetical protein PLP49_05070 [Anaerohalosphaeraceae bacterium]|nr:hypothetical protein [Anaerohalosphaeraceae bacterium]HPB92709.1 hypothetical protein [Anaerohalosphaeraceae bacterium]HRT23008.1 hypothetical protein [Anaerohalosphaeraceae bacterium]